MTAPAIEVSQVATIGQYATATEALRNRLLETLLAYWAELTVYRDAQAAAFSTSVAPVVIGAQQVMSSLTANYLTNLNRQMVGTSPAINLDSSKIASGLRSNISPQEVYQRPFTQIWTDLSQGKPLSEAVASGRRRLVDLATSDLQLAKTTQAVRTMSNFGDIVGYRRVLVGAENCGLCVIASTVRYRKSELMPIHPGCNCAIAPIHGHQDPGQSINSGVLMHGIAPTAMSRGNVPVYSPKDIEDMGDLLAPVHDAIERTFGQSDVGGRLVDYRKIMTTHEHGELGPILSVSNHSFTGPGDLK